MAGPGGMKVTDLNGVKVYTVSGQRSIASWVNPTKLRSLRKDEDYMRRIELLQDLQFDTASTRMKVTPDGQFLVASGTYPSQVKVYELKELTLKFERHLISDIINFQILTDDYSKMAFLCADRSICLHAKFGSYFSTRIPSYFLAIAEERDVLPNHVMGRDLTYDSGSCDILVAASSSEIYRLNLEQGQFLAPLQSRSPGANVIGRSPVHGLIAMGGEDGAIECFDLRQKAAVGRTESVGGPDNDAQEITALRFDEREGMLLAAGTSSGQVLLYDLRSSAPILVKDHLYGAPIVDIKWHETVSTQSRQIITADTKVVRIWDPQTGKGMTSVESPAGDINDLCIYPDSGLLFMALDSPRIPSYFIPALGPAPKWCSFLENLTEELEENSQSAIYDNFKFVTRKDLERLNLTNLLGTNLLRAYMHGFFIDHRLHAKAKAMVDPFAYEAYRQQRVQEKLDAERASRITVKKKLPKVNKELAVRLLTAKERRGGHAEAVVDDDGETVQESQSVGGKSGGQSVLTDERFSALFNEEAFQVDEDAAEYKALHPNAKKSARFNEHFDLVSEAEIEGSESDSGSSSEEDNQMNGSKRKSGNDSPRGDQKNGQAKSIAKPRLYEAKDEIHAQAFRSRVSLAAERRLPLEERVGKDERSNRYGGFNAKVKGLGGSREISFNPGSTSRGSSMERGRNKRSIESLGLRDNTQGRGRGRGRGGGGGGGGGRGSRGRGRGRGRS